MLGIPEWQLLCDCEVWWLSSYLMIGRALTLYPVSIQFHLLVIVIKHHDGKAIRCFLAHPKNIDIVHHLLSSDEFQVLQDIHQILEVPHTMQELLSAERRQLSLWHCRYMKQCWIPGNTIKQCFRNSSILLMLVWKKSRNILHAHGNHKPMHYPWVSTVIMLCYYIILAIVTVLNPAMKFKWLQDHWSPEELEQAGIWLRNAVSIYYGYLFLVLTQTYIAFRCLLIAKRNILANTAHVLISFLLQLRLHSLLHRLKAGD